MTWDIAKSSIDFLYNYSQSMNDLYIYFYGGEPFRRFAISGDETFNLVYKNVKKIRLIVDIWKNM